MNGKKVGVVTGARRGIGRAVALALAESGFDLVLNDLVHDEDAERTLALVSGQGAQVRFLTGDIAEFATHAALVEATYHQFGRADCLVNNAGAMSVRGEMLDVTPDDYDRVLAVNLRGTFFLTQAMARRMIAEDGRREGRTIITITSANSVLVSPEKTPYCLSKSALSMMVQLFGARLAPHGIASFEIRPGFIKTEMSAPVGERFTKMIAEGETIIRRWGEPEDVGMTVASLATGALRYSAGQPILVDGGLLVHRL
jgi:3-oxoacyl-[acyl-carrier protein] reductase